MRARMSRGSLQLRDLMGPYPGQGRRSFGRVRDGRYLRPGLRPLARGHAIWSRRSGTLLLPGWTGSPVVGCC